MRKFKCIGLEESTQRCWAPVFTVGEIYEEHHNSWPILMLKANNGDGFFVDEDQFVEVKDGEPIQDPWKLYRRKGLSEMRAYIPGEDMSNISVSPEDHPELDMGVIARNPKNHRDQWYVNREYFLEHLEEVTNPKSI